MSIQWSVTLRNARLDAIETTVGTSPTLEFRTGAQPANCAAADSGTLIVSIPLPSDWMAAANAGAKAMTGTWPATAATGAGDMAHYRLKASGGTVHEQGTVTATGGGGDITVQNVSVAVGQNITVTGFTKTEGYA